MTHITKNRLTVETHLDRDPRLDFWTMGGIGPSSHTTENWVQMILNVGLSPTLPEELVEIYSRAQACMVYGCYHYPLFTLGCEELFRFGESSARLAAREIPEIEMSRKTNFFKLISAFRGLELIDEKSEYRWQATRSLRNSSSHKERSMLVGPNDALSALYVSKELTEELFQKIWGRTI